MKRVSLIFLLVVFSAGLAFGAGPSLIRVSTLDQKEMKALLDSDRDLVGRGPDFLELVVPATELEGIKKAYRKVEILVPDLDALVKQRMEEQTPDAKYFTYESMTAKLEEWAGKYPEIARLSSIGKSFEGREIWAMKVSDNPDLDEKEAACFLNGAIHAREWMAFEVTMETLKQYLEGYGSDERITRLVNEREVWFVPMVNPDGVSFSQNQTKFWRKNRRTVNDRYWGVDLNRNFSYEWGLTGASNQPYSDTYHGAEPFSEPETQALRDLTRRENFQAGISFHSYSELILYPFAYSYDAVNPNEPLFKEMGRGMAEFNKYKVQNCTELYPCMGVSDDWFYGDTKMLAFTFELGRQFIPPATQIPAMNQRNVPAVLWYIDHCAAAAINSPTGDDSLPPTLDLEDCMAALELGRKMMPQYADDARERVAHRLQRVVRRAAHLTTEQLFAGDTTAWNRVLRTEEAKLVMPVVKSLVLFEACHGRKISPDLLQTMQQVH